MPWCCTTPEAVVTPTATASSAATPAAVSAKQVDTPRTSMNLTGGAAILARLRSQKGATGGASTSSASGAPAAVKLPVTFLYGSQLGTGQEIARNLQAEAKEKGYTATVSSLNEKGFANINAAKTPIVVLVASSTGDGDPPDNAANFWVQIRRCQVPTALKGVQFTCLGLGDSNYTRYMHFPRVLRNRFTELGANQFYAFSEADEVSGIEKQVDSWTDALWPALAKVAVPAPTAAALQDQSPSSFSAQTTTPSAVKPMMGASAFKTEEDDATSPPSKPTYTGPTRDYVMQNVDTVWSVATAHDTVPDVIFNLNPGVSLVDMKPGTIIKVPATSTPAATTSTTPAAAAAASTAAIVPGDDFTHTPGYGYDTADAAPKTGEKVEYVVPVKDESSYGLVNGYAPENVDLKGVAALASTRVKVVFINDAAEAQRVREAESSRPSLEALAHRDPEGVYSREQPYWATLTAARLLTAGWSQREVVHVELELGDSGMAYQPGDAIAVLPANPAPLVESLLSHLGLDGDAVFTVSPAEEGSGDDQDQQALLPHLGCPATLRSAFSRGLDLTGPPRKSLLRLLAEHCEDPKDRRTLMFYTARAGRDAYTHEMMEHQPSLLQLLTRFPSCKPPLAALLDALPPLGPRMYSLSSSPSQHPTTAHVALSVVNFTTRYGLRAGVASNWLANLAKPFTEEDGETVSASPRIATFLRSGGDFKPPSDLSIPIIMIGPGTGVAPFRGFLQQRRSMMAAAGGEGGAVGESWLFFGCRRYDEDFLYKDDLQEFVADGTLSHLKVAYSRAQAHKVYVQHLMKEAGARLMELIEQGAYVYVCGDGAKMAKDVNATLVEILKEHGVMDEAAAASRLQDMTKSKRYVRDIW